MSIEAFVVNNFDIQAGTIEGAEYYFLTETHVSSSEREIHNLFIETFADSNDILLLERESVGTRCDLKKHWQTPFINKEIPAFGWDIGTFQEMMKGVWSDQEIETSEKLEDLNIKLSYAKSKKLSEEEAKIREEWKKVSQNYHPPDYSKLQEVIDNTFSSRVKSMVTALESAAGIRKFVIAGYKHFIQETEDNKYSLGHFNEFIKDKKFVILTPKEPLNTCSIQ